MIINKLDMSVPEDLEHLMSLIINVLDKVFQKNEKDAQGAIFKIFFF